MTELDKLQEYLEQNGYTIKRIDTKPSDTIQLMRPIADKWLGERHQIIVYGDDGEIAWDAICHLGSYGFEQGLLEVMGSICRNQDGVVEGWLTAQNIIDRLEE